jgi:Ca2+-binding RTX toxin-like protein
VTKTGDKVVIETTKKDDKIGVPQDAKTGDVTVEVNGKTQTFSGKDKDNLVIRAGEGNDTVTVGKGVTVKLTIEGGDGDDTISGGKGNDTIEAGAGDDTVDGGEGRDYIFGSKGKDKLAGGAGNDVIYGGDDDDTIDGGDGDDYLEGGKGNDTITGGKGKDILSGGIGDDTLKGGDGDDGIYAGQGKDKLYGEKGNNKIFSQADDTDDSKTKGVKNTVVTVDLSKAIGTNIVVNGSDEFKERIEADLEMLRGSQVGRQMLEGFDNSKHTVTIEEFNDQNGRAFATNGIDTHLDPITDKPGKTDDATFQINPRFYPADHIPPIVVFYHEMAHAYDYTHGTLANGVYDGVDKDDAKNPVLDDVNNAERVAVGLPIDHDTNPKTKEQTDANHPEALTENALRKELNRPIRPAYRKL